MKKASIACNYTYGYKQFRIYGLHRVCGNISTLQSEKSHLVEGMGTSFVDELLLKMGLAEGMEFELQDGWRADFWAGKKYTEQMFRIGKEEVSLWEQWESLFT